MRFILGPPGSGKTTLCLSRLREALRSGRGASRLIVPTATMAEHLRNQLAREGFVFKPALVSTFTKFIEPYCLSVSGTSSGAIEIVVEEVLSRIPLTRYEAVRNFPGFRASIVHIVEEFSSAGGTPEHLAKCGAEPDLQSVYEAVLAVLKQRNLHLRAAQLRQSALRISEEGCPGIEELLFTGFYSFTAPELEVIRALDAKVKLTVTLADWSGAKPAIDELTPLATSTEQLDLPVNSAVRTLCVAPTLDAEVAEIARRILQAHGNGRAWREMGVLLRNEPNYVPALRSAFQRFGIPARFYFSGKLSDAPAVQYFRAIMDALLSGWDHASLLRALRLPGSRLEAGGAGDAFEFEMLSRIPGAGLDTLVDLADAGIQTAIRELETIAPWTSGKAFPQTWAARLRKLRRFFVPMELRDGCSHDVAMLWRSHAAALDGFEAACDAAALALDPGVLLECKEFWSSVRTVLTASELRVPDHRRDVVHVIDAFEARQWSLPIVFVCGLLEKEFPKYQTEDPILPDAQRWRLQAAGVHVRTSQQRQLDERFLFDLAVSRAREALVLSYPQLNAKGEANLASFFLAHAKPFVEDSAADVRPTASRPRGPEPSPLILTEEGRQSLRDRHTHFTPTGIETYLQCPYQFFAQRSLRLAEAPEAPWDRLNALVQGEIVHSVLERSQREQQPVSPIFDEVFADVCREKCVPPGYRTEAIRLELLYNLEAIEADARLSRGVQSLYEEKFKLQLDGDTLLSGKIDRLEVDADNRATVIDYKYRSKPGIDRTKKGHEEKKSVQGGLYLLAAQAKGFQPAGMVYCGLRREVSFGGWMLAPNYPEIKQTCEPQQLESIMRQAAEDSLNAVGNIREGRVEPNPADETKCQYCSAAQTCRYEVAAMQRVESIGAGE